MKSEVFATFEWTRNEHRSTIITVKCSQVAIKFYIA